MNAGAGGSDTASSLISVDFIDTHGQIHHFTKTQLSFGYRFSSFQEMQGVIVQGEFSLTKDENAKKHQIELLQYRMQSQPYRDKSAGCAFKNPTGESAGKLIEMCGLKGKCVGDAEVSMLHANFIINKGSATARDVLELIQIVKETVREKTGVQLALELKVIPYEF
jgi:UDP-N-acetylmuramate dehydrogenase